MDEDKVMDRLVDLKTGQARIETCLSNLDHSFTNHLAHHREDTQRNTDRLHKWIYFLISTGVIVVSAAYYLGKN